MSLIIPQKDSFKFKTITVRSTPNDNDKRELESAASFLENS